MLCWPCDIIVAASNAEFSDPVVALGVCGVEYFAHTFELGPRKAKELLFTADSINADEARDLGMVNTVVPADQLDVYCSEMAAKITAKYVELNVQLRQHVAPAPRDDRCTRNL